ncbi:MAG: DUF1573 domain-containing protein [Bacteroidetes bacterium]|nr:MAG: DUF1573 domain-containing protein [Bacteroidota bacterium]
MKLYTLCIAVIFTYSIQAQEIPEVFPKTSLVGYWSFNFNANDESAYQNNGEVHGAEHIGTGYYRFDGQDDNIILNELKGLELESNASFTIQANVKSDLLGSPGMIFSKMHHSSPYRGFEVFTNTTGRVLVYIIHNADQNNFILLETNEEVLSDKLAHHLLVTYDGSSSAAGIKIYVDGIVRPHTASTDNLKGSIKTNAKINIGSRNEECCFEAGIIDEIAVWKEVLGVQAISKLYNFYKEDLDSLNVIPSIPSKYYTSHDYIGSDEQKRFIDSMKTAMYGDGESLFSIFMEEKMADIEAQTFTTMELIPSSYDFETIQRGSSYFFDLEIVNTGENKLAISGIDCSCECFSIERIEEFIYPNQSKKIKIKFTPLRTHSGQIMETMTIIHQAGQSEYEIRAFVN